MSCTAMHCCIYYGGSVISHDSRLPVALDWRVLAAEVTLRHKAPGPRPQPQLVPGGLQPRRLTLHCLRPGLLTRVNILQQFQICHCSAMFGALSCKTLAPPGRPGCPSPWSPASPSSSSPAPGAPCPPRISATRTAGTRLKIQKLTQIFTQTQTVRQVVFS